MTIPAYLAALLLSTLYGAGFHTFAGGGGRRLVLFLLSGWLGFALGHVLGNALGIRLFMLGPLNLTTASLGSFVALFAARWLTAVNLDQGEP